MRTVATDNHTKLQIEQTIGFDVEQQQLMARIFIRGKGCAGLCGTARVDGHDVSGQKTVRGRYGRLIIGCKYA